MHTAHHSTLLSKLSSQTLHIPCQKVLLRVWIRQRIQMSQVRNEVLLDHMSINTHGDSMLEVDSLIQTECHFFLYYTS